MSDSMFGPFLPMEEDILAADEDGHTTLLMDFQGPQRFFQVLLLGP
jgi:hypothetical protein